MAPTSCAAQQRTSVILMKMLSFEMLLKPYLAEVHVDVFSGLLVELCATDLLCKAGNANSVAGVKLLDEEITAGLDHAVYLVHDSTIHHMDDTLLTHRDAGCVGKLYQSVHNLKW